MTAKDLSHQTAGANPINRLSDFTTGHYAQTKSRSFAAPHPNHHKPADESVLLIESFLKKRRRHQALVTF